MSGGSPERPVVLIHGLWMPAAVMIPLARQLRRAGFTPYRFGYPSRQRTVAAHAEQLDAWLEERFTPGQPLGFVGHSLGGIVLRALAERRPEWFSRARTVQLGTPNRGSAGAAFLAQWGPGRWWLGLAGGELCANAGLPWPAPPGEVAVLAGTRCRWWTRWLLDGPNDGLVAVSEACLPGAELRTFPVGHTGMIFNRQVAEATAHFLVEGRLDGHGEPAPPLC
ncbi:MAG: esterase/lipase family protein [Thiohalospira sp.]|uniref:esterase/lipase family protein n=1 Tax=Thiohalorhabdus sp. TaxID=3094134 RepID=UPI00397EE248